LSMSSRDINRRYFLTLPLALVLAPWGRLAAQPKARKASYAADVGILYDLLSFHLDGTIDESVDRGAGRYRITVVGQGSSIANRIESEGALHEGRWVPLRSESSFQVHGRESRSRVVYDYGRRAIDYHAQAETFFLRRRRIVDDVLAIPEGLRVDDALSAVLNFADGQWPPQADGAYRTHVVRRYRTDDEGPDDVAKTYRGELAPFELHVSPDPASGKSTALFDLTRFSSWARRNRPARIVFGPDRRPELITTSMMLGTSVTIRFGEA
jgi:hypothetical protein